MPKYFANYLFVYGYLMSKNRVIKALGVPDMPVKLIGEAYVFGNLFQIEGFPGLVYDNRRNRRAYGEVYLLRQQKDFFREMDAYELSYPNYQGDDSAYHRRIRPAHLADGRILSCWVYEYIQPTDHLEQIKSGRFKLLK